MNAQGSRNSKVLGIGELLTSTCSTSALLDGSWIWRRKAREAVAYRSAAANNKLRTWFSPLTEESHRYFSHLKLPSHIFVSLLHISIGTQVNKERGYELCADTRSSVPPIFYTGILIANHVRWIILRAIEKNTNKYKINWIKLKDVVGMAGSKSTLTF